MIIISLSVIAFGFSIFIEGSWWLFIAGCLAAILFSYFIYKHTTPPVSRFFKAFLFLLRSFAILLLLLLLFHPILTVRDEYVQKPDVAVLIDQSRSLQITDQNQKRSNVVHSILQNKTWNELRHKYNVHFFPFASQIDTTYTPGDSLSFNGDATDISRALEMSKNQLLEKYYAGALLISDGIYNTGENPEFLAQRYGVPIYTIGVGNPEVKKDVILTRILTNDVVYRDNRVPVDISVTQSGFAGKRVQVLLKHNKQIVDQQTITLADNDQDQHILLHYKESEPGFQKFQVEIPAIEGEFTRRNNYRSFAVRVLENKIKILLLAGEPSVDYKFLKRGLEQDENIEVISLVQQKGGGYYFHRRLEPLLRDDYQLFIFLDFPRWSVAGSLSRYLTNQLVQKKKPLFFIQGPDVNIQTLRSFAAALPFQLNTAPRNEREVVVDPTILGEESPVVLLVDNRAENQQIWNKLPPIQTYLYNFTPTADSEVLLQIAPGQSNLPNTDTYRKPILLSRQLGEQKSLALMGFGFWHWDLFMWGVGKTNDTFLKFLQRSVRWLITREDVRHVQLATDKYIYRSGEQVYVQAQVYTEDYRPVEDAAVTVQVKHDDEQNEYHLESIGNGKYQTQFRIFKGGDYQYVGQAQREDQFFGADTGRFSVGEYEIEFEQTRMNENLLQRVAQLSGGKYVPPDSLNQLTALLPDKTVELAKVSEINLWNEWLALILFIILLSIEWTIRRRKGML